MSTCVFFNGTATTEIYTLSLHDALPISCIKAKKTDGQDEAGLGRSLGHRRRRSCRPFAWLLSPSFWLVDADRKSTRLNSSHANMSYAVFCLKKKTHIHHPVPPFCCLTFS